MNCKASTSKDNANVFEDDELFEDSAILANFDDCSFKDTTNRLSETFVNNSGNKSGLNVSALCCDEELSGYDKLTGKTWIYPTNYPVRDYQFNIIKSAILKNTLVSLPTGLGKTFIAAVIMYNFYRWYPLGKIVFTAPTRPLVAQQIEACYNIVAIPANDTVEMTGHMQVNTRKTHWQTKRVFFATPQVIYNDIKSGICPAEKFRCLVIDEAHRARGNYAYCQIVGTLTDMGHKTYRVLALSATPGSKVEDVVNVVKNLHIAHLELRTENCIDVAPYSHVRKINTVIVQLGPELSQLRHHYVDILDSYARRLKQLNILPQNLGNLSKGRIVMLYKEFQNKERTVRHPQHNYIMKDFTLLIALYHGLELLVKHGSRVFLNFFDEHPEKSWIQSDDKLTALLERLRDDLGINPLSLNRSVLPDGTVPEIPKDLTFGHPKFYKLKEIMLEHFRRAKEVKQDTRAIVFCEYRESVNLVHCLLLQCRPLIIPQMFVGQGASGKEGKTVISQKQQLRVMRNFREGVCNTLVATCVAEEGLDVGSVDLIICFDISTRSPVRLVQRCGRTGRERGGQVHILVTEGREHQTLKDCMQQRDGLNNKVLKSVEIHKSLYEANPRLIPYDFTPQCQKMHLTIAKRNDKKDSGDKGKKNQKDLRTMLLGRASSSISNTSNKEFDNNNFITEQQFSEMFPDGFQYRTPSEKPKEFWAMNKESFNATIKEDEQYGSKLSVWLEWQRTLQNTVKIGHSKDSEIFASLLQYSDAKRFELPASTQNPTFATQDFAAQKNIAISPAKVSSPAKQKPKKKPQYAPLIKSPVKRDGDIRALFSTATKSTKSYTKLINDLGLQNDGSIPTKLISLFVDLSLDTSNIANKCYICECVCNCAYLNKFRMNKNTENNLPAFLSNLQLPDIDVIDLIDIDAIRKLKCDESKELENNDISYIDVDKRNSVKNFDLEFDFEFPIDLTSPENIDVENNSEVEEKNFDLGDIEDIFANSSDEAIDRSNKPEETKDNNSSDPKEALGFFGLESIDDIFADSDNSNESKTLRTPDISKTNGHSVLNNDIITTASEYPKSPSILSGKQKIATSPIICSQGRKFSLSTKKNRPQTSTPASNIKRRLIPECTNNNTIMTPLTKDVSKASVIQNSLDTTDKSMFTITQLVQMINKTDDEKSLLLQPNTTKVDTHMIEERSVSPILLTQADKKRSKYVNKSKSKPFESQIRKGESLIVLETDSESDNDTTQVYEVDDNILSETCVNEFITKQKENESSMIDSLEIDERNSDKLKLTSKTPEHYQEPPKTDNIMIELDEEISSSPVETFSRLVTSKRKLNSDESITPSPYFHKRPKFDNENKKQLTLQEKILAAITSNKLNSKQFDNDANINFVLSPKKIMSQKENKNPEIKGSVISAKKIMSQKENNLGIEPLINNSDDEKEYVRKRNLEMLQIFRRDSKAEDRKVKLDSLLNSQRNLRMPKKRKLSFRDSDDDFVDDNCDSTKQNNIKKTQSYEAKKNHKVRKKNKKTNDFLDLEAELSGNDSRDSGDELSDESIGSIIDFICDDNETHHVDMQAHYMRSVKSPVNGVFKIPLLLKRYDNADVFSQFVEEDAYEMDSFCVDSHVGLTQVNDTDVSELDVAEMILERKKSKKRKARCDSPYNNDESPLVRRKFKTVKRIESDSDDSS